MPPAGRRSRARLDAQRRAASRAAPAERLRRSPSPRLPPGALQRRAGSSCGSQGPPASGPPMRRPHPCAHLSLCLLWTHGRTRLLIQFLFYDDADEGEVE
ncbi:uncharacterized protein LOC121484885 isoform X2 [Vulpes lagopus]|uniref:uncharacterized protein LOC121484885 isoform X2 n=1 Tax=Vulpes lagopus TaxID=494514 RepID=UPI001BC8DB15|nr:uncharacterized protein LOC121484885 isoform X2 [Vulpes lagopus]